MGDYYNPQQAPISIGIPGTKRSLYFASRTWVKVAPEDEGVGLLQKYKREGRLRYRSSELQVEAAPAEVDLSSSPPEKTLSDVNEPKGELSSPTTQKNKSRVTRPE